MERTLSIIKPDTVQAGKIGQVAAMLEQAGLQIVQMRMESITAERAADFYREHQGRPYFDDLVGFMTSAPVVLQVLQAEGAILLNRRVMGATDPSQADTGTIRAVHGTDIMRNAVHGSDSAQSAQREIAFFFGDAAAG